MDGSLPINVQAAANIVRSSRTNYEKISHLNKFVEEFYKTIAIIFITRYNALIRENNCNYNLDIQNLVEDHFHLPTFNTWIKMCKLCGDELSENGDDFAKNFQKIAYMQFTDDDVKRARTILKEINNIKGNTNYSPPKRVCMAQLFEIMREMRNFTVHEWTNNPHLNNLIESGIDTFIIENSESFFSQINIQFFKIISVEPQRVEIYLLNGVNASVGYLEYPSEVVPPWDATYIKFNDIENSFKFYTFLFRIDEQKTHMFIYTSGARSSDGKYTAKFDNLPLSGDINKIKHDFANLHSLAGIPSDQIQLKDIETSTQKYGKILENNGIIHNLNELTANYISRPVIESDLFDKLAHPRLYITTLDGGGGFGKTELAKKVLWDIINRYDNYLSFFDSLDYVIWLSAKATYFEKGQIVTKDQTFKNLEDLLDCILYVTNNTLSINCSVSEKIKRTYEIFNQLNQNIVVLDNLETVDDIEPIWNYLVELGREVKSDIKVIITSRILSVHGDQRLNVRAMEIKEGEELVIKELNRLGLNQTYNDAIKIKKIASISANIPLLIKHFVSLLERGYTLIELEEKTPKDSTEALKFICEYQWKDLSINAKKLLIGIAKNGGRLNFYQAKLVCNLDDTMFFDAREQLQNRSFLVDSSLQDSILETLSPITLYVKSNFALYPDIIDDINEHMDLIKDSTSDHGDSQNSLLIRSDDITLNNILQKADMLNLRSEHTQAYKWFNEATKRFPTNSLAWSSIGEFEFKYLEDDEKARSSFDTAIKLDPKNHTLYRIYAYWEYDRGAKHQKRPYLKRSIELNEKALEFVMTESETRTIKDHIASSYMKLGYIEKQEAFRSKDAKNRFFENANKYFKKAISILTNNLVDNPSRDEIRHNILDYSMLINAYLQLGGKQGESRDYCNDMALLLFIRALKLDNYNEKITNLLTHPIIGRSLSNYRVTTRNKNESYMESILNLEETVSKSVQAFERKFPSFINEY